MTSGVFTSIPISSIIVNRDGRQRRELEKVEELAASIRDNGLINPILVTREHVLIAGERRLEAHRMLGALEVQAQYVEDLDPIQRHILELEENIQRVDLAWQDHVRAVADYHRMKQKTEEKWSMDSTATALNMSSSNVQRNLLVDKAMAEQVPQVLEAPKFSTALNFAQRREERRKAVAKRDLVADIKDPVEQAIESRPEEPGGSPAEPLPKKGTFLDIQEANFLHWSAQVQSTPFNLLHVDFPYGVSAGDTKGQSAAKSFGGYDDRPEVYRELCEAFINNLDNFCAPSAHLIFWFSMDYYEETRELLRAGGWSIDPFPLVWYKGNTGILPDANRGPRRVYETAFFGSRGDRKIVRAVGNAVEASTPGKDDKIHMSQKAQPMLEHFFRMLVDEYTRLLDPTCGSGIAPKIASLMGAEYSLGLELNPDYVADARLKYGIE